MLHLQHSFGLQRWDRKSITVPILTSADLVGPFQQPWPLEYSIRLYLSPSGPVHSPHWPSRVSPWPDFGFCVACGGSNRVEVLDCCSPFSLIIQFFPMRHTESLQLIGWRMTNYTNQPKEVVTHITSHLLHSPCQRDTGGRCTPDQWNHNSYPQGLWTLPLGHSPCLASPPVSVVPWSGPSPAGLLHQSALVPRWPLQRVRWGRAC